MIAPEGMLTPPDNLAFEGRSWIAPPRITGGRSAIEFAPLAH